MDAQSDLPSQSPVAVILAPMPPLRTSVLANAPPGRSQRTSPITGRRPSTSSGPTEALEASTGSFQLNIRSTPAKPPRFLMTSECLPTLQLPPPQTDPTPPRTKLSFVSTLWLNPLVMTLSQLSGVRADSGPKLYVLLRRIHPQKRTHVRQILPSCWDGKVWPLFNVP